MEEVSRLEEEAERRGIKERRFSSRPIQIKIHELEDRVKSVPRIKVVRNRGEEGGIKNRIKLGSLL